jgi:hypothetical protein
LVAVSNLSNKKWQVEKMNDIRIEVYGWKDSDKTTYNITYEGISNELMEKINYLILKEQFERIEK